MAEKTSAERRRSHLALSLIAKEIAVKIDAISSVGGEVDSLADWAGEHAPSLADRLRKVVRSIEGIEAELAGAADEARDYMEVTRAE